MCLGVVGKLVYGCGRHLRGHLAGEMTRRDVVDKPEVTGWHWAHRAAHECSTQYNNSGFNRARLKKNTEKATFT